MRTKRLYRVRWQQPCTYREGHAYDMVRHYQSKRAAEQCAERARTGREELPGLSWDDEGLPEIPPAVPGSVHIDVSEPIMWGAA